MTNIPNRTITLTDWLPMGDGSVRGFNKEGEPNWQLSAGNYVDRVIDPELIFPRPDSETPVWAKHRRHHPNVPYRIPIGVSFGSWPFYFEAISVPSGATVGSFLTPTGDSLIVGDDYGVVEWANPTAGNHSFHIRVHFQDGYAPLDVQWTLEVTTVGTIFVDAVSGNDTTGDGTIANPFQTAQGWYEDDHTLKTYSGYQVCYRAGTHILSADNTAQALGANAFRCDSQNKPLVHYAYPGETVVADFSLSKFTLGYPNSEPVGKDGADWFWSIDTVGIQNVDNPALFSIYGNADGDRAYTAGQGGQRMTWFECEHKDAVNNNTSANNAGVVFAPNAGENDKRHYILASRVTFNNVMQGGGRAGNFNGYYLSSTDNWLSEHITDIGCNFGLGSVVCKSTTGAFCARNIDASATNDSLFKLASGGSYDPDNTGYTELSYSKFKYVSDVAGSTVVVHPSVVPLYEPLTKNHKPAYLVRNTLLTNSAHGESDTITIHGGWDTYMYGNYLATNRPAFGVGDTENINSADTDDYVVATIAAVDGNLNLVDRVTNLGQYGAEVLNEAN